MPVRKMGLRLTPPPDNWICHSALGDSATPYSYSLSGSLATVSTAAVSQSGMDGNDGAWAVLSGIPHVTTTSLNLHAAEDEFKA